MRPNRSTAACDGGLGVGGVGDVELDDQEVVVLADRRADLLGVAAGGDDRVTGGQGGLGDVDAHAAAGAGDEPNLLVSHAGALLLLGSCRSARSISHISGTPRVCVHHTTAGARNNPTATEVRSASAHGVILNDWSGVGRHLNALRRC